MDKGRSGPFVSQMLPNCWQRSTTRGWLSNRGARVVRVGTFEFLVLRKKKKERVVDRYLRVLFYERNILLDKKKHKFKNDSILQEFNVYLFEPVKICNLYNLGSV